MTKMSAYLFALLPLFFTGGTCVIIPYVDVPSSSNLPEQIHLSWTGDPTSMFVTWATPTPSAITEIHYGETNGSLSMVVNGSSTVFTDGAKAHKERFIHRATFVKLKPGTRYYYQCRSDERWSKTYSFRSIKAGRDWSPRFLVYGDMGEVNARSLAQMTLEVQQDRYDMVLHVGDFAYDMDNENGDVGDAFLRSLEPLAAIIPYMTVVGNHEQKYNFSHYRNRFTTPGDAEGMFYSFDIGPLHISVVATEFYFFLEYGVTQIFNQYRWFMNDLDAKQKWWGNEVWSSFLRLLNTGALLKEELSLQAASKDINNGWIWVAGHRPMYCSNPDIVDCNPQGNIFRRGIPFLQVPGLENLMHDTGVDVGIWAHEHSYERTWPVYDVKVLNGSATSPYTDPKGIVHVITGSAVSTVLDARRASYVLRYGNELQNISERDLSAISKILHTRKDFDCECSETRGTILRKRDLIKNKITYGCPFAKKPGRGMEIKQVLSQ